jgi:hypothetical protein
VSIFDAYMPPGEWKALESVTSLIPGPFSPVLSPGKWYALHFTIFSSTPCTWVLTNNLKCHD